MNHSSSQRLISEALSACEPEIRSLLSEHKKMSQRWMSHEILPWGQGRDFREEPWSQDHSPLPPSLALAFETNLLTEDNLPYYHTQIANIVQPGSALQEWNHIWTSEEAAHSIAMRDYALLMRILDPERLEKNRFEIMRTGFNRQFENPLELFAYTSVQELATRVSHLKLGQKAQEPVLMKIMTLISRDENYHYLFYRGIVKLMLEILPEAMLRALMNQLFSFHMPGVGLEDFQERHDTAARLGIYGALEHRDFVLKPVFQYWGIAELKNLSPEAEKIRDRLMRMPRLLDRLVERQQTQTTFTEIEA